MIKIDIYRMPVKRKMNRNETSEQTIGHAISQAVMENKIVHLDYTPELEEELLSVSDDNASGECLDFWGMDDGHDWRVILDNPPSDY